MQVGPILRTGTCFWGLARNSAFWPLPRWARRIPCHARMLLRGAVVAAARCAVNVTVKAPRWRDLPWLAVGWHAPRSCLQHRHVDSTMFPHPRRGFDWGFARLGLFRGEGSRCEMVVPQLHRISPQSRIPLSPELASGVLGLLLVRPWSGWFRTRAHASTPAPPRPLQFWFWGKPRAQGQTGPGSTPRPLGASRRSAFVPSRQISRRPTKGAGLGPQSAGLGLR